ncbi:sulfotransferase, partial [Thiolapillus sp.]
MRLLITGQPASGLFLLAALLRRLYGLDDFVAPGRERPENEAALVRQIEEGAFPEDCLLTGHYEADPALLAACDQAGIQMLHVLRDPCNAFETLYFNANNRAGASADFARILHGQTMDSKETLDFIQTRFAEQLRRSASWIGKDGVRLIHQERLVRQPETELELLSASLGELQSATIRDAVAAVLTDSTTGSGDNPLSDSRLPAQTLCAINKVLPLEYRTEGYREHACSDVAIMNQRMSDFSTFTSLYADKQRVFLVGHGKSGTTWLHMLFFHHPNTAVVAERRLFEHPDHNHALFDSLLDDAVFDSWFQSSSFGVTAPEQTGVRYELSRIMSDYLLYRALAVRKTAKGFDRKEPISHFSEKIALNTEADANITIETLKRMYPDAKIIHIVRDPRDVAVSAMFHSYRNFSEKREKNWITDFVESALAGDSGNILKKQAVSAYFKNHARAWNRIASIFHQNGKKLYGDNYLLVRYEDLLAQPMEQVTQLFSFSGLPHAEDLVAQIVDKASFKNLSQGRKAGEQDSSSFYRKGVS